MIGKIRHRPGTDADRDREHPTSVPSTANPCPTSPIERVCVGQSQLSAKPVKSTVAITLSAVPAARC